MHQGSILKRDVMSLLNIVDKVKYHFGRFILAAVFLIVGIYMLYIALVPKYVELNNGEMLPVEQSDMFLYGALFFLLGSIIWFLYLLGLLKTMIGYGVMVVSLVASIFILYYDYQTVKHDVDYIAQYQKIDKDIIARMYDLKEAEAAFKEFNKYYTNNIDTLIWFVKNGKKMTVPNIGTVPDRKITPEERDYIYGDNRAIDKLMTDKEAHCLAKSPNPPSDLVGFSRDTIYKSVLDAIFYDERFKERRLKHGAELDFHPDSLRYVPYSLTPVVIDTNSITKGDFKVPTLLIKMVHPLDSSKVYTIGSLSDNHLRDNWSR